MSELLPCPHCGGTDQKIKTGMIDGEHAVSAVYCMTCGCSGAYAELQEHAIETWNRRVTRTAPDAGLRAEIEKMASEYDERPDAPTRNGNTAYRLRKALEHAALARTPPQKPLCPYYCEPSHVVGEKCDCPCHEQKPQGDGRAVKIVEAAIQWWCANDDTIDEACETLTKAVETMVLDPSYLPRDPGAPAGKA